MCAEQQNLSQVPGESFISHVKVILPYGFLSAATNAGYKETAGRMQCYLD